MPAGNERKRVMKHMLPFLLCLVAAPCAMAQPDPAEVPEPATEAPLIRTTPELAMTPMQREIQQLLDREREALRVLRLRFENASGVDEAVGIQREMRQVKLDSEIALMETQLRYLRQDGNEAAAASVEETLRLLRNPEDVRRGLISPSDPSTTGQQ